MEDINYEAGKFFCDSKTVDAERITEENFTRIKDKYDFIKNSDLGDYLVTNGETYVVKHGHFRRYYCPVEIPALDKLIWSQLPEAFKKNYDTGLLAIEAYKKEFPDCVEELQSIIG